MAKLRMLVSTNTARSRLWIDDVEISEHVRGFTLTGIVTEISELTLTLSIPVEVDGDVARVLLNRRDPLEEKSSPFDGRGVLQDGSTPERMRS